MPARVCGDVMISRLRRTETCLAYTVPASPPSRVPLGNLPSLVSRQLGRLRGHYTLQRLKDHGKLEWDADLRRERATVRLMLTGRLVVRSGHLPPGIVCRGPLFVVLQLKVEGMENVESCER